MPSEAAARPSLGASLTRPVDAANLVVFRVLFGLLMAAGAVRFVASGWIDTLYLEPTWFFPYDGFEWVNVWPRAGMIAHFSVVAVSALFVALGLFYRVAIVVFVVSFAWAQLFDVTNYLNHYYLVVVVGFWLSLMPLSGLWSLDRRLGLSKARETVPAWMLYAVRFQLVVVYFYAALAKAQPDWLVHGQPLAIWLAARDELPLLGGLFRLDAAPVVMSWAGFLYDLTIWVFLLIPRTRLVAYGVVVVFHTMTHVLFDIGLFPFIMTIATLVFFAPNWPRRWLRASEVDLSGPPAPTRWTWRSRLAAPLLGLFVLFQLLFPLRHYAMAGDVLWNEQGMRWSWKVMVRAKRGSVTYRVKVDGRSREWQVSPQDYLHWRQANEMSAQPDLIWKLARHIGRDFEQRGYAGVEVRVDALASLNGRTSARLIDPDVDLYAVHFSSWATPDWILVAPSEPPP